MKDFGFGMTGAELVDTDSDGLQFLWPLRTRLLESFEQKLVPSAAKELSMLLVSSKLSSKELLAGF